MDETRHRRRRRLAAGVILVLVLLPSALAELAPARPAVRTAAVPAAAPPELVALALAVEAVPRFETSAPAAPPAPAEEVRRAAEPFVQDLVELAQVPEPSALWLALLSAASAAAASPGTRRCLRRRRRR